MDKQCSISGKHRIAHKLTTSKPHVTTVLLTAGNPQRADALLFDVDISSATHGQRGGSVVGDNELYRLRNPPPRTT